MRVHCCQSLSVTAVSALFTTGEHQRSDSGSRTGVIDDFILHPEILAIMNVPVGCDLTQAKLHARLRKLYGGRAKTPTGQRGRRTRTGQPLPKTGDHPNHRILQRTRRRPHRRRGSVIDHLYYRLHASFTLIGLQGRPPRYMTTGYR